MTSKKIVLTGPESTGKTTLAKTLASYFAGEYITEFARKYIDDLQRPYIQADLLAIARGQVLEEDSLLSPFCLYI